MKNTPLTDALNKHRETLGEKSFTEEIITFFENREHSEGQMKSSELIDILENLPHFRKIIFLDIDGVMNNTLHSISNKENNISEKISEAYLLSKEFGKQFQNDTEICARNISVLNKLVSETGAGVVITSVWRKYNSLIELKSIFKRNGFIGEIIGTTPFLSFKDKDTSKVVTAPRGFEIDYWLKLNEGENNIKYIIFDDDADYLLHQRENFIWVDPYAGLTDSLIYQAKRKLNI